MNENNPAKRILNRMFDRLDKEGNIKGLPQGLIVHAIEQSRTFGNGGKSVEGEILIEQGAQIRRASGHDIAMLNEIAPDFLKHWRLPEKD